jgi:hypothetical protein
MRENRLMTEQRTCRLTKPALVLFLVSFAGLSPCLLAAGLTLQELEADAHLTPDTLLEYFSDFGFELHESLQKPEVFLSTKCGDCDDFAILAATLLAHRGYTPHLVAVFMEREVHVVCFVAQTNSYLDYNHRKDGLLVSSNGALDDIADKVARSFRSPWHSVSEFTYDGSVRQFVRTEFH